MKEEISKKNKIFINAITAAAGFPSPAENYIEEYLDIGKYAEGDHGDIPSATNDSREADKPIEDRSKDVGYGHKVKEHEEASGFIHGIKFKKEDGTYIPLTEEQKIKIKCGRVNVSFLMKEFH